MRRLIFALIGYAVAQYLNSRKEPEPETAHTSRRKTGPAKGGSRKPA